MSLPLYITCKRPGCHQIRQVRDRRQQRKQRYCSRRCVGLMRQFTQQERQRGAEVSKAVRRAAAMVQLDGLSPVAIYRKAFSNGWKAATRSVRRRLTA